MADWMKTAKQFLLADGKLDDREVAILRKELFADGTVDETELEFLFDLRRGAKSVVPSFHFLIIDGLKSCCLEGGAVRPSSLSLLRRWLGGGAAGYVEKRYLEELRAAATRPSPELEQLYRQVTSA